MAMQKLPSVLKYKLPLFAASDDSAVMKNIQETHKPDGRVFDVKPVLGVVEQIFNLAAPTVVIMSSSQALIEDKAHPSLSDDTLGGLAFTIHKIACEITCKCSGGSDSHATTMALLNSTLSPYAWDAKVVLTLAAFAMSYGEFWLTGQLHAINPLAKSVALLKQLPDVLEHAQALKPRFDVLNNLIKALLGLTRCIIEFSDMPVDYISLEDPAMATAQSHIPTAVYWIIKSVVTSSSQIIGLIGMSFEYLVSTSEAWELSSLAHKVNNIHDHLRKQLEICLRIIDERRLAESYRILEHLFETTHLDNMKIMKTIFSSKDDFPFIQGSLKTKVNVDTLRRKIVLLLISDLQMAEEEVYFLSHIYSAHKDVHGNENSYEVIWVPIVDSVDVPGQVNEPASIKLLNEKHGKAILELAAKMPWLTAYPQPQPNSAFVKYIRSEWRFGKKTILIVLDGQGKVINPNALYMLYIWGALAYPFSSAKEEALWMTEKWGLELVVDHIDPAVSQWINENKHICLYGGEDIDWIRSFTSKMKEIMKVTGITIEMVYVGKAHPKAPTKKIIDTVQRERLSLSWPFDSINFFWMRLDSMMHSLMLHEKGSETGKILQEVITLLTYGNNARGWALISKGAHNMMKAEGQVVLHVVNNIDAWKDKIAKEGLPGAMKIGHDLVKSDDHCVRLVLPRDSIVHEVACPECRKKMERYLLFQCCDAKLVSPAPPATAAANAASTARTIATPTAITTGAAVPTAITTTANTTGSAAAAASAIPGTFSTTVLQ